MPIKKARQNGLFETSIRYLSRHQTKYFMKKSTVVLIVIIIFLVLVWRYKSGDNTWGSREAEIEKIELLILHNEVRSSPLKMELECDKAAQSHADWMAANNKMSHHSNEPGRKNPGDRLKKSWRQVAENIAKGQKTPADVTNAWMNSRGHRNNILNNDFKHVGFGIAKSENGTKYWCAVFSD